MAKQPTRPKFYWDGGYLSELETRLGDKCIFLCLSPVSFRMLTDMSAMLLWATRYQEGVVPEVGRIAHQELNVPCLLDLYSRLDELNNTEWLQAQFDALGSRMTELEEMDINVTQTVGGGCGCGCDGETTSVTQTTSGLTIDPEDTGIIPPYMTEAVIVSDPVKCRSANYLATTVISAIRSLGQIGDAGGGIVFIVPLIIFALTIISPIIGDEIAVAVLIGWAVKAGIMGQEVDFLFEYFSDLANMMEGRTEELVCLLYEYNTASELGASLSGYIENMVEELRIQAGMSDVAASMLSSFLVNVFGSNVINLFVENVGTIVPADFVAQYDCLCGATGDTCPTAGIVLAGVGTLPAGDLTGTTQGFASSFNSSTGYYEVIFELPDNYCVTIDNGAYTPTESHETCSNGVMVASDGSCIRRFAARSLSPFATAVTFDSLSADCSCPVVTDFVPLSVGEDYTYNQNDGWQVSDGSANPISDLITPSNITSGADVCSLRSWCMGVSGWNSDSWDKYLSYLGTPDSRVLAGKTGFTVSKQSQIRYWAAWWGDTGTPRYDIEISRMDGDIATIVHSESVDWVNDIGFRVAPVQRVVNYTLQDGIVYNFTFYVCKTAVGGIEIV